MLLVGRLIRCQHGWWLGDWNEESVQSSVEGVTNGQEGAAGIGRAHSSANASTERQAEACEDGSKAGQVWHVPS